jgi:hypothetical protein
LLSGQPPEPRLRLRHTASGWLIGALWKKDRPLALQVFGEMLAHLRAQDFRKGPGYGAPWEVFGLDGQAR